jgi:hypothetical protein
VKRSLDSHQKRVIISSQDYGSTRDFEAALKRVYKTGVVCNLKTEHLKALIHVKLRSIAIATVSPIVCKTEQVSRKMATGSLKTAKLPLMGSGAPTLTVTGFSMPT